MMVQRERQLQRAGLAAIVTARCGELRPPYPARVHQERLEPRTVEIAGGVEVEIERNRGAGRDAVRSAAAGDAQTPGVIGEVEVAAGEHLLGRGPAHFGERQRLGALREACGKIVDVEGCAAIPREMGEGDRPVEVRKTAPDAIDAQLSV